MSCPARLRSRHPFIMGRPFAIVSPPLSGKEQAMADIATRVYNHTWKIDPIVRSVLDTDFYKLLMAQTIFRRHRDVQVTFGIHNRTTRIRLADIIDAGELREQLDHVRSLSPDPGRVDLAARQHLLRQAADVLAGIHGLARDLPLSRNTCWRRRTASTS